MNVDEPPEIVIVFSAPVPLATTPAPAKLRVVARVDRALPSSLIVIPLIPPPPDCATQLNTPLPSVLRTSSASPSSAGRVSV